MLGPPLSDVVTARRWSTWELEGRLSGAGSTVRLAGCRHSRAPASGPLALAGREGEAATLARS